MPESPQPFQVIVKSSKKLEELEQLELSEKKKKVDELQKELNTIKTLTPKLFKDLSDEIEKLITQIKREANTVSSVLEKQSITISEIITKIEDPKIYEQFLEDQRRIEEQIIKTKKQEKITLSANSENDNTAISTIITTVENPEIYKQFLKDQDDPIEAIITKILAEDLGIDSQFKKLFKDDPDSIKKIITEVVKENAIKKIITEIKDASSKGSEAEGDEFEKIITKILQEDSLISKYYKKDSYSIAGIIDQLQHEKADENPIEKITTQILSEKEKAFKAIAEDPLGQIIIEHKIEKANSPQKEEADTKKIVVKGQEVKTQIYSNINQEIVEQILFKDEAELPITKSVEKKILDAYQYRSKIEFQPTKETSFFSGLFSTRTPKNREKGETAVPNTTGIESDMVFVELYAPTEEEIRKTVIKEQNIKLIQKIKELAEKQAQEELAEKDEKGRSLDVKKLLIYAELIAKIPKEYSESISSIHQEIIYLKKQEKGHKKTLNFLKELIQEEEIIAEKKRIAKEITQQEKILGEIAKDIAEERKLYFEEQERIDAEKIAKISVEEIRRDFEDQISEAKKLNLQEQKKQITKTLTTNSQSLIKTKTDIDRKVREILSSEYVDEKLPSVSGESTMEQLLIEAIIVDEAKNKLTPEETKEIESKLKPESPDSASSEIDKKALNLLIIQKALEKILKLEQQKNNLEYFFNDDSEIIVEAIENIDTPQNKLNFFKPNNKLNLDALALLESKEQSRALEERLAEINALEEKLSTTELELPLTKETNTDISLMERQLSSSDGNNPEFIVSALISEENQPLQLQNTEQTRGNLGSVAQQDDAPPPPTILRTQEEKKQFLQTFISTRLREKLSNSNQNLSRNKEDDSNQDNLDTRPQSSSTALESENSLALLTSRSTIHYSKEEDEIEERRIGLYTILDTILKTNLEKQNTTEFDSHSIDEEEIDVTTAENNIEFVMTQIATLTSDLASSISKNENKQTGETLQSEAYDSQIIQNFSTEDPIIYSGIGIRIKLEDENGEYSLKITEVFENSDLKDEDVNKKITHIKCGDELKSITAIYEDCKGDDEKFYTKIALIFRDEKQEKLTLKIEGEEQERNVVKNIFIPEDKKGLNIYDNSQMTKIANKLRAPRQISSQLTTTRESTQTA